MTPRLLFAIVQVLGGLAVLGSYAWGIATHPNPECLWGTIPEEWVGLYSSCMPFAAIGYLVATGTWWRRAEPADLGWITATYAVFLTASTAWMPLSLWAFDQGDPSLWPWIQLNLAITAFASCFLGAALVQRARLEGGLWTAAAIGWCALCWQTVALDAVVWPQFFVIGG